MLSRGDLVAQDHHEHVERRVAQLQAQLLLFVLVVLGGDL